MFYIFNKEGQCVGSCDGKPNTDDLATRGETVMEAEQRYKIDRILLEQGKIKEKPPAPAAEPMPAEPVIDDVRLAAFEAMAAQEERMAEQAKRIAELETMVKAGKGGEGK